MDIRKRKVVERGRRLLSVEPACRILFDQYIQSMCAYLRAIHRYDMVTYTAEPAMPQRTYFLPNFIFSQATMPVPMWCFCRVLRRSVRPFSFA